MYDLLRYGGLSREVEQTWKGKMKFAPLTTQINVHGKFCGGVAS